jgi:hypothetical protein
MSEETKVEEDVVSLKALVNALRQENEFLKNNLQAFETTVRVQAALMNPQAPRPRGP